MKLSINFRLIAEIALAIYLICVAGVYLSWFTPSLKLLGWSAFISAVAFILSLVVTGSYVVGGRPAAE